MTEEQTAAPPQGPHVQIQKLFLKDLSVEVPGAPGVFTKAFKPKIDVALNTEVQELAQEAHQVVLSATVTARQDEEVAYLVECHYAGVFVLSGVTQPAERQAILGAWAPNNLFPYLREVVSDLIQKAGFPPFFMQPVNFDAALREHLGKQGAEAEAAAPDLKH